jgi:hypothetical protein
MASDNNPAAPSLQGTCEVHIPMADHMGNIRNYIHARSTAVDDGSGSGSTYAMVNFTPSANFEYDAFGREVRANGTTVATNNTPPGLTAGTSYADALPFHFSSKFTDPESGLNYYGYRYYDPKDGRWLSRDPIGERGGLNLYGMCYNNALSFYDFLGRDPQGQASAPAASNQPQEMPIDEFLENLKIPPRFRQKIKDSGCSALTGLFVAGMGGKPKEGSKGLPEDYPGVTCFTTMEVAESQAKLVCGCDSYCLFAKQGKWKGGEKPSEGEGGSVPSDSVEGNKSEGHYDYQVQVPGAIPGNPFLGVNGGANAPDAGRTPQVGRVQPEKPKRYEGDFPAIIYCYKCRGK